LAQPRPNTPKDDASPASARSGISLTIYSTADPATYDPQPAAADDARPARLPGHAVVRETRRVTLPAGESTVRVADVPASIDPTTVSVRSLTAPDSTGVLEQDFLYDAATPDKLLERYVGLPVIVNRKQEPLPGDRTRTPDTIEGKLLAFTHDQLVIETNNRQLPVQVIPRNQDITEVKLFELKGGLVTRPTLAWRVNTDRAGDHDLRLAYQTADLTWRADYAITLDAKRATADVGGWVTIVNASGAAYPEAGVRLVAGDVPRAVSPADASPRRRLVAAPGDPAPLREPPEPRAYALPRPTTLANNAARQLELFPPRSGLAVSRAYVYQAFPPGANPDRELPAKSVDAYLQLPGEKSTALPAGRARIYRRDAATEEGGQNNQAADADTGPASVLVAEQLLPHTPKGQPLLVRLGTAPSLAADRRITDSTRDAANQRVTESIEITLRNPTPQPVKIVVWESAPRSPQWEVTDASAKYEKTGPRTIEFPTDVPANGEATVTYKLKYQDPG
jgi:hypothetical protein